MPSKPERALSNAYARRVAEALSGAMLGFCQSVPGGTKRATAELECRSEADARDALEILAWSSAQARHLAPSVIVETIDLEGPVLRITARDKREL